MTHVPAVSAEPVHPSKALRNDGHADVARRLRKQHRLTGAAGVVVLVVMALIPNLVVNDYQLRIATFVVMYMGLASSWNLFSGLTGYASFGHAAFFGCGAYVVGIGTTRYQWSFAFALASAFVLTGILSLFLGLLTLRLRGHYFAIATLGIAEAALALVNWGRSYTKGTFGFGLPLDVTDVSYQTQYLVMLAATAAVVLVSAALLWSRWGARLLAVREDELAAQSLGINVARVKIFALGASGAFTGVFGGLFAWVIGYVTPDAVFTSRLSLEIVVMAIVGGSGTVLGPLLGAVAFYLIPQVLMPDRDETYLVWIGLMLVAAMLFLRQGVVGALERTRFWPRGLRL